MKTKKRPSTIRSASWLPGGILALVQNAGPKRRWPRPARTLTRAGLKLTLLCCHANAHKSIALRFQKIAPWEDVVRDELAPLDAKSRADFLAFLTATTQRRCCREAAGNALGKWLFETREVLRERMPLTGLSQDDPRALHIELLIAADDRTFYVRGWFRDEESTVERLTAVSPEGARVEILNSVFRFDRPDIVTFYNMDRGEETGREFGFIRCFESPVPSTFPEGWLFEMESKSGDAIEARAPRQIADPIRARDAIFADLVLERPPKRELISRHVHPAIRKLQKRRHAGIVAESVEQYGTPTTKPEASVIVPLYERIDFLEHQLAQFVHDAEFRAKADLIYVLDSPAQAEALARNASRLARLYDVPFRVVSLNRNGGFSTANNIGIAHARCPRLLLLNSDVLPGHPGWLGRMAEFHEATPRIGALGAKLIFEDETLQHAGLYFSPMPDGSGWENLHFYKGLHRSLPAANIARPVPAVTAACLMIDRALYEDIGGLRGMYVQGDYEDSDLCLRLIERGLENWYLPGVELHHLEGQSYPAPLRALTSRYNRWLHNHTWRGQIESAMQRFGQLPSNARRASAKFTAAPRA